MKYHTCKEYWIEPWKWALEAGDEAPTQGEKEIASVVKLPSITVCGESVNICLVKIGITYTTRP